jgi:hypothetical protein
MDKKTIALAAVLAASTAGCKAGWNSFEASAAYDSASHEWAARNRSINNVSAEVGNAEVSYHGLNEVTDGDGSTYFGNNRILLRRKGGKVKAMVRTIAGEDGISRTMAGARLPKLFGDFGFVDATADGDGANLTIFSGMNLGERSTLEFLHSQNWAFDGKPTAYNELQYNRRIGRHWEAVVRAEVPNYDHKKASVMFGFRWRK